jgi:hypothetical protein
MPGRSTVLGVAMGLGAFVLVVGGTAVVVVARLHSPVGFITPAQYGAVSTAEHRSALIARLGPPDDNADAAKPFANYPTPPPGSFCDYYSEADAIMDAGAFRFCYVQDTLVSKDEFLP